MNYEEKYNEMLEWARKKKARLNGVPIEEVLPELAESEDERIRKTLIDALKTSKSVGELKFILPEPTREECLAYLEKQGEQKVSVDDFKAKDWYVSKVDGKIHNIYYSVDKVKPKFKVGDKIIEKNFDECGRGTIIDIKDGKYIFDDGGFICIEEQGLWKLVEQKPAEWSDTNELVFKDICNHLEVEGYSGWVVLLNALRNGEFQPKQEWNTHDKAIVNCIVCCLDGQFVSEAARKQSLEWFNKHRRDFLNSTSWKPWEWSEEDERMRKGLINFLRSSFIKENITDETVAPWIAYLERMGGKQKA